jgi:hypothetical protein
MCIKKLRSILVVLVFACPAIADPFWVHSGKTDMETEGWTYNEYANPTPPNLAGPVGPMEAETASEDAWKFVDQSTNYRPQYESPRMTAEQAAAFADAWEFKVRMNVVSPSVPAHGASFQFIEPGDPATNKVYRIYVTTNASSQQTVQAYNLSMPNQTVPDPLASGFHTYRLVGSPSGVNLFIDDNTTPALTNIIGFGKDDAASVLSIITPTTDASFATIGSNASGCCSTIFISEASFSLLEAAAGVAGDFNGNGTVDVADYVVWRKAFGTSDPLSGNGDENGGSAGTVDDADYQYWIANFGNSGPAAAAGAQLVPEPAVAPLIVGMIALMSARRLQRAR